MNKKYRILVIGQSWHGSNCTGLARGFRTLGHLVELIGSDLFFPKTDKSYSSRALRRIMSPFYTQQFNQHILNKLSLIQPEIVVVFKGSHVLPQTLAEIRTRNIWLCNFFPDISFFAHKTISEKSWNFYNHIFTTKEHGAREMRDHLGIINVKFLQHGFDPCVHRPLSANDVSDEIKCDISFIGGQSPTKEKYLCELASNEMTVKLKIWGDRWDSRKCPLLKKHIQGFPIFGDFYALAINNSKINLGLLQDKQGFVNNGDQVTSRTFHIPACGGFLLHERTEEVQEYFEEDKEIACFDSLEELIDKIRYFLKNERERKQIAHAGYERCIRENGLSNRAQVIIDHFEKSAQ